MSRMRVVSKSNTVELLELREEDKKHADLKVGRHDGYRPLIVHEWDTGSKVLAGSYTSVMPPPDYMLRDHRRAIEICDVPYIYCQKILNRNAYGAAYFFQYEDVYATDLRTFTVKWLEKQLGAKFVMVRSVLSVHDTGPVAVVLGFIEPHLAEQILNRFNRGRVRAYGTYPYRAGSISGPQKLLRTEDAEALLQVSTNLEFYHFARELNRDASVYWFNMGTLT